MRRPTPPLAFLLLSATLSIACAAPATPATPSPTASSSNRPGPSRSSAPVASASPSAVPPSPTMPTEAPAWSARQVVRSGECGPLSATFDGQGTSHVAALCDGGIRTLVSSDGVTWTTTDIVPAIDLIETDPILAMDGATAYLAYSLLAPFDGGCGDDGRRDVGVHVRTRTLPDGPWSEPRRVGLEGDRLQSFRASGGVLHLTVTGADGAEVSYIRASTGPETRIAIPDAIETSLRVGDDGRARIAYSTGRTIRYATVDGTTLAVETIAESDRSFLRRPSLVLAPSGTPAIVWTQTVDSGRGCVSIDRLPLDGTWVGVMSDHRWVVEHLSPEEGRTSITFDPESGDLFFALSPFVRSDVRVFESHVLDDGHYLPWSMTTIPGSTHLDQPALRRDPATNRLVLFAIDPEVGVVVYRQG